MSPIQDKCGTVAVAGGLVIGLASLVPNVVSAGDSDPADFAGSDPASADAAPAGLESGRAVPFCAGSSRAEPSRTESGRACSCRAYS